MSNAAANPDQPELTRRLLPCCLSLLRDLSPEIPKDSTLSETLVAPSQAELDAMRQQFEASIAQKPSVIPTALSKDYDPTTKRFQGRDADLDGQLASRQIPPELQQKFELLYDQRTDLAAREQQLKDDIAKHDAMMARAAALTDQLVTELLGRVQTVLEARGVAPNGEFDRAAFLAEAVVDPEAALGKLESFVRRQDVCKKEPQP
jgi:hypothetical protein